MSLATSRLPISAVADVVAIHQVFDVLRHNGIEQSFLGGIVFCYMIELVDTGLLLGIHVSDDNFIVVSTSEPL